MQLRQQKQVRRRRQGRRSQQHGLPLRREGQHSRFGGRDQRGVPLRGRGRETADGHSARRTRRRGDVRRHADPRTGHDQRDRRRTEPLPQEGDGHAGQRRQRRLRHGRKRPRAGVPQSGNHRRASRGHRTEVRTADPHGPGPEPRQPLRRDAAVPAARLRAFGAGDSRPDRQILARNAADQRADGAESHRRAEKAHRRGPTLHQHPAERRRGPDRHPDFGGGLPLF